MKHRTVEVGLIVLIGSLLLEAGTGWAQTSNHRASRAHAAQPIGPTCGCKAHFTIEKRQEIAGSASGFTTSPLVGSIGQSVDYEITVKNTGSVDETLSEFSDPHCDAGTIAGGPGSHPLFFGESTTYTCDHVLSEVGQYTNEATVTATEIGGMPEPKTSNQVVVEVQPAPAFTIEKLQKISGPFTTAALTGEVGQTVAYEILVTDTGNTSLTLAEFKDEHCDAASLAGGPSGALAAGESTIYTCDHVLSAPGSYENNATVTGAPPTGQGTPITHTSNTVLVTVASPAGPASPPATSQAPTASSTPSNPILPIGEVKPFVARMPSLKGPQGCVRQAFAASVNAAGVGSVTFYLDGRKLKKMTARNARKGQLTINVRSAGLRVGPHTLAARITTIPTATAVKSVVGVRSIVVVRCASSGLKPTFAG
jgi:hypothetical protein